jgi:hypothetical protein
MFEASDEDSFCAPQTCCGVQISFYGKCLGECGRTVVEPKRMDKAPEEPGKENEDGKS